MPGSDRSGAKADQHTVTAAAPYRALFDGAPLGTVWVDAELRILRANHAFCRLVGAPEQDLTGAELLSLVVLDDGDAASAAITAAASDDGATTVTELRWRKQPGGEAIGRVRVSVVGPGSAPSYVVVVEDVTAERAERRRRAEGASAARAILDTLTAREREVLECLATGMTAAAIAARLAVSVRTVESHLASGYRKLSVRTRSDAAERYYQLTAALPAPPDLDG